MMRFASLVTELHWIPATMIGEINVLKASCPRIESPTDASYGLYESGLLTGPNPPDDFTVKFLPATRKCNRWTV